MPNIGIGFEKNLQQSYESILVMNAIKYCLLLPGFLFIMLTAAVRAQQPANNPVIPEKFCISANELLLANLINEYRHLNNLPVIPLSRSLFFVARTHVLDLTQNHPDNNKCNQHSWSDKGNWKPCCYSKEPAKTNCMTDKPKELAGYKGKGYELIYWDSEEAIPSDALELWKSIPFTKEILLNQGKWKTKAWKSCGVGMLDGYASVWFGDARDQLHGIKLCLTDSVVEKPTEGAKFLADTKTQKEVQPPPGNGKLEPIAEPAAGGKHYYLITGSFKIGKNAHDAVAKLRNKGYRESKVLENNSIFRVALAGYATMEEAEKAMHKLTTTFKGIWIFKY